jgi:hypothetical protein
MSAFVRADVRIDFKELSANKSTKQIVGALAGEVLKQAATFQQTSKPDLLEVRVEFPDPARSSRSGFKYNEYQGLARALTAKFGGGQNTIGPHNDVQFLENVKVGVATSMTPGPHISIYLTRGNDGDAFAGTRDAKGKKTEQTLAAISKLVSGT